jgi:hypothetical protein
MGKALCLAAIFAAGISLPLEAGAEESTEPYGKWSQSGRHNLADQAGYQEWFDVLIIREDDTAELVSRVRMKLNPDFSLLGCEDGVTEGVETITYNYQVTQSPGTVTLIATEPGKRTAFEPECWEIRDPALATEIPEPLAFEFVGGHLRDENGEYFRQD